MCSFCLKRHHKTKEVSVILQRLIGTTCGSAISPAAYEPHGNTAEPVSGLPHSLHAEVFQNSCLRFSSRHSTIRLCTSSGLSPVKMETGAIPARSRHCKRIGPLPDATGSYREGGRMCRVSQETCLYRTSACAETGSDAILRGKNGPHSLFLAVRPVCYPFSRKRKDFLRVSLFSAVCDLL